MRRDSSLRIYERWLQDWYNFGGMLVAEGSRQSSSTPLQWVYYGYGGAMYQQVSEWNGVQALEPAGRLGGDEQPNRSLRACADNGCVRRHDCRRTADLRLERRVGLSERGTHGRVAEGGCALVRPDDGQVLAARPVVGVSLRAADAECVWVLCE